MPILVNILINTTTNRQGSKFFNYYNWPQNNNNKYKKENKYSKILDKAWNEM